MTTFAEAMRSLRAPDQRSQGRALTSDNALASATPEGIAHIEACATAISAWNPMVIPGLLQTNMYAAGAIKMGLPAAPIEEVYSRARQRSRRVADFLRRWQREEATGQALFIIGEAAITQPVIGAHAHADQIRHLLDMAEFDRIHIQVLRQDVPTPGRLGCFTLYRLEPTDRELGSRLAYFETPVGGWYTQRVEDTARMYSAFCDMIDAAMSPAETRAYLMEEYTEWSSSTERDSRSPATPIPGTAWRSRVLPPAQ